MNEPYIDADGHLHHPCSACGEPGSFGYGVNIYRGRLGTWYCGLHNPEKKKPVASSFLGIEETEWLNKNPESSRPGTCAFCGREETPTSVIVPYGAEPGTHAWIHRECWPAWFQARREKAAQSFFTTKVVES
jgi:hypothetical protein